MIQQIHRLNLIPNHEPLIININQNDTGSKRLLFSLFVDDDPLVITQSMSFLIVGTKPDGSFFNHTMTIDNNMATVDLFDNMTDIPGDVRANVIMFDGDSRTGSQNFILRVQKEAKG